VESEEEDVEPTICSALFPIVPNIVLHEEGRDEAPVQKVRYSHHTYHFVCDAAEIPFDNEYKYKYEVEYKCNSQDDPCKDCPGVSSRAFVILLLFH